MAALFMISAFLLVAGGTHFLLRSRVPGALLDIPGPRSNHARPTPRIGGVPLMGAVAAGWLASQLAHWPTGLLESHESWVALAAGGLAALSLADDIRGLPAAFRLCVQAGLVALATWTLAPDDLMFAGALPLSLDRIAVVLLWLGLLNATNFMDGIDGITGASVTAMAGGLLLLLADADGPLPALPTILAGATLGFLWFNWHPARIFLGDVGSVPVGFLLGALLIGLAMKGYPAAAAILPAYYIVDTGLTLMDRLRRHEPIWQAHSSHAYQRAVRRGLAHDRVALAIGAVTLVLVALAFASRAYPLPSVIAAYCLAGLFYWALRVGIFDFVAGLMRQPE